MAAKGTVLSRSQVAKMMATAQRTTLQMREAEVERYRRSQTDPFEKAKLALQRAGRPVFSHSLHVPGSTLIVVGTRTMPPAEVIAYAQQYGRW